MTKSVRDWLNQDVPSTSTFFFFFYHWVHEEVRPAPGLSLHKVTVGARGPDLKRIRLANHLGSLDVVYETCPVKWKGQKIYWNISIKGYSINRLQHLVFDCVPFNATYIDLVLSPHFALWGDINTYWLKSIVWTDDFHHVRSWRHVIHSEATISSEVRQMDNRGEIPVRNTTTKDTKFVRSCVYGNWLRIKTKLYLLNRLIKTKQAKLTQTLARHFKLNISAHYIYVWVKEI